MGVHDHPWEEIAEYLEGARGRHSQIREALAFHEAVLRLQCEAPAAPDLPGLLRPDREGRNRAGVPVLPRSEFVLDLPAATRLFHRIGELLLGRDLEARGAAEAIDDAVASGRLELPGLLRGALKDAEAASRAAEGADVDPDLLSRWCAAAAAPSAEACRRAVARWADPDRWLHHTCPVCGSPPRLSELRGAELAATRYLHCGFCGHAWAFRRQECPFCRNRDHERLVLWTIEGDRRCHVEVCQACRRYLKVVDNKEFFGLIPFLEDLATPHLDVLARDRGYW